MSLRILVPIYPEYDKESDDYSNNYVLDELKTRPLFLQGIQEFQDDDPKLLTNKSKSRVCRLQDLQWILIV